MVIAGDEREARTRISVRGKNRKVQWAMEPSQSKMFDSWPKE